jgi:hypothetical protein
MIQAVPWAAYSTHRDEGQLILARRLRGSRDALIPGIVAACGTLTAAVASASVEDGYIDTDFAEFDHVPFFERQRTGDVRGVHSQVTELVRRDKPGRPVAALEMKGDGRDGRDAQAAHSKVSSNIRADHEAAFFIRPESNGSLSPLVV